MLTSWQCLAKVYVLKHPSPAEAGEVHSGAIRVGWRGGRSEAERPVAPSFSKAGTRHRKRSRVDDDLGSGGNARSGMVEPEAKLLAVPRVPLPVNLRLAVEGPAA